MHVTPWPEAGDLTLYALNRGLGPQFHGFGICDGRRWTDTENQGGLPVAVIVDRDAISRLTGLTPDDAYALCGIAADLMVTQAVNIGWQLHCALPRRACSHPRHDRSLI